MLGCEANQHYTLREHLNLWRAKMTELELRNHIATLQRYLDSAWRRLLVGMDNGLLRRYSALKRRLGMSDAGVSRLMRWVDRGRSRRG